MIPEGRSPRESWGQSPITRTAPNRACATTQTNPTIKQQGRRGDLSATGPLNLVKALSQKTTGGHDPNPARHHGRADPDHHPGHPTRTRRHTRPHNGPKPAAAPMPPAPPTPHSEPTTAAANTPVAP